MQQACVLSSSEGFNLALSTEDSGLSIAISVPSSVPSHWPLLRSM